MKFVFDWQELKIDSGSDLTAILILTFAIYRGYNNKLAWDKLQLKTMLTIDDIPGIIVRRKHIVLNKFRGYTVNYQSRQPSAYFQNPDFMFSNCSVSDKVKYIYLLSHRRIADDSYEIPTYHIKNQKLLTNPFVRIKNDKLKFIPESLPSIRRQYVERI